ncbi:MAG: xanthine dehydrogenase family protein molybdopterin-binding subunit, partial [Acidimicrobiales bacterium]
MPGSLLGDAVVRIEDPDLLAGRADYVDDLPVEGVVHLAFVRSPIAHGVLGRIDASDASSRPGVVAVLTAADLGLPAHHTFFPLNAACARPPLAEGKVRCVGDAVAVVAAETRAAAVDAAEAVVVDYDPLPVVAWPEAALEPGAPLQFEAVPGNLAAGSRDGGPDPLAGADVVVRGRFENQRVAVVPMEGNAIVVVPEGTSVWASAPQQSVPAAGASPGGGASPVAGAGGEGASAGEDGRRRPELTVYVSTQMPHMFAKLMSEVLGLDRQALRVVAPHVGGAFGSKAGIASEHTVAVAVARRLGRPVKWVETRSENLVAMPHGRGQVQYVELGLTRDGRMMGLRCRVVGDAGAYGGFGGGLAMGPTRSMAQGVYRIPSISYDVAVALTNTTTMGAFRGAGRPEAAAMLERVVDMAADELGMDPAQLRRRNLLAPSDFPFTTVMGTTYDSGEYAAALDKALSLVGYEGLLEEQAGRRRTGDRWQLGIGIGTYVEVTAGGMSSEYGSVEIHPDGTATVTAGTSAHGQGHATSFAMVVADRLGIPVESVRLVQSDTAVVPRGSGTGGSRSLQIGGNAVGRAAEAVLHRARALAGDLLEARADDIVVMEDGRVGVAGVPARALSWSELAGAAAERGDALAAALDFEQAGATFPFGAHVAVVEVDTETGRAVPRR